MHIYSININIGQYELFFFFFTPAWYSAQRPNQKPAEEEHRKATQGLLSFYFWLYSSLKKGLSKQSANFKKQGGYTIIAIE